MRARIKKIMHACIRKIMLASQSPGTAIWEAERPPRVLGVVAEQLDLKISPTLAVTAGKRACWDQADPPNGWARALQTVDATGAMRYTRGCRAISRLKMRARCEMRDARASPGIAIREAEQASRARVASWPHMPRGNSEGKGERSWI